MPDLASMLSVIGFDRLVYVTAQKIGSHHIHGTWSSLLFHYLEEEPSGSGAFVPRGHDSPTHESQYLFVPLAVLQALAAYVTLALEPEEADAFTGLFESTAAEIQRIAEESSAGDYTA
jgi:hypothetical protein